MCPAVQSSISSEEERESELIMPVSVIPRYVRVCIYRKSSYTFYSEFKAAILKFDKHRVATKCKRVLAVLYDGMNDELKVTTGYSLNFYPVKLCWLMRGE